ncbi:MAG TPA: phosphate ABC transporter permease [Verrucomicrobia bacterium]|nr:MAG: phosphate ABC transporter permease [Lentisphaerae bacterium GWF2_57_35]HBA83973.1 phosphate ABC transporter permease [Verrucomicrobiota bacterium]
MTENVKTMNEMRRDMPPLLLSHSARRRQRIAAAVGNGFLLAVTSLSALAVLFIFYFIARDAWPFFRLEGVREFFTSVRWYPSADHAEFGALAMFVGSGLVTLGAILVAVPLGVAAAVCLSDVLPFSVRQVVKPVIEILAAIPSVAYGFFALVVLAPLLQESGGPILGVAVWIVGAPLAALAIVVVADLATDRLRDRTRTRVRWLIVGLLGVGAFAALAFAGKALGGLQIASGANALNVSIILGIMALPTVVSVSEDALQAVERGLREGSYALGATRAETLVKTVLPAAGSGILAAVILGVMRAIGETMVVWMASGNAAQIPSPWYNFLEPVRTLTATIAGDMGEADHVTGSARYHVLFLMALCLLVFSLLCNLSSEWVIRRTRKKTGG